MAYFWFGEVGERVYFGVFGDCNNLTSVLHDFHMSLSTSVKYLTALLSG